LSHCVGCHLMSLVVILPSTAGCIALWHPLLEEVVLQCVRSAEFVLEFIVI
jgi:hypothetical protein